MKTIYDIDIESLGPIRGFNPSGFVVNYSTPSGGHGMFNQLDGSFTMPSVKFNITDQAQVDGETWYTIACDYEVSKWLRDQPKELQYSHIDKNWTIYNNKFDIHEKLYTLMALRWT